MSQSEESTFTYYAFVSYSHKDAKWAEWIQHAIEHYRLPAVIRKEVQKPLPKRIAPVFRDATDLGVDVLVDGLHEELEKSRFLIVVCSPNSAKPNAEGKRFVDEEVRHFCELGREKQIIPVIIEGTPEESFGPVLKSREIFALDATKQPKARILNNIVAKILGLKPDVLWRRAERERRKRLVIRSILCGILGVAVAFIGLFAWDANRTVTNYYADYVDSFGLPEGIFPLKKADLAHRHIHYRFEYEGFQYGKSPHADSADRCIWNLFGFRRRLVRVVQANSRGYPRTVQFSQYADRPQIQDFRYDKDLRLREIRTGRYNGDGREPWLEKRIEFSNARGVTNGLMEMFVSEERIDKAFAKASLTIASSGDFFEAKSDITQHLVGRDVDGRVTQWLFLSTSSCNIHDGDGIFGVSYEHDCLGRQTAQWYLIRDGDGFCRQANKKGVAGLRYEYVGHNMRKVEYMDSKGRPAMGPNGWMICVNSFDKFDNNTESWYSDQGRKKSICAGGNAGHRAEYDISGNIVRQVFLDIDGKLTLIRGGYAETRMEYDWSGNRIRQAYFGVDGKPTLHTDGYAGWTAEYNERGNITKSSFWGVDGNPISIKDGYAGWIMEYDGHGNPMKQICLGIDGKPTLHKDWFAELHCEYDERGNRTRQSFWGVDGKPTLHKDGFAEIRWKYDGRGNRTHELYFGTDGKLVLCKGGSAGVLFEYDAHGNMIKVSNLGVNGKLTLRKDCFAEMRMEHDTRGNITKLSYFGVDGKPTLDKDGNAGWIAEYDERGRETRRVMLGVDVKPMLCKDGFAEYRIEYEEERGNETKRSYFGVDGKPTLHKDGYAEIRKEYDVRGKWTHESYFGVDGNPTLHKDGFAEMRWECDVRGDLTKISYFGVNGKPTLHKEGYSEIHVEYDARGNITKQSYFGVDGKPTLHKDGFAEMRWECDARGNLTKVSHIGVDGKPALYKGAFAEMRMEYDSHGSITRQSYFGVDGKPTLLNDFAEIRMEYDECGHATRKVWIGVDGRPAMLKDGYAEIRKEYDVRGNWTHESYFGVDGKPTLHKEGYAEIHVEYDARGNITRESFFGLDGKPALHEGGFVEIRNEYDAQGNRTHVSFFGVDGKPTLHKDGYAEVRFTYKKDGTVATTEFFDVSGNKITLRQVVMSVEVNPNLAAEKSGVKKGDVWCRLGVYDILKSENVYEVEAAIQAVRNAEKELVVARKTGDAYEIHSFKFPVGGMGVRVNVQNIPDFDKLSQAYKAYCEEEKKEANDS